MSTRIGSADCGLPSGPMASTLTLACEPPSWLMLSGMAFKLSESANVEGPLTAGTSLL